MSEQPPLVRTPGPVLHGVWCEGCRQPNVVQVTVYTHPADRQQLPDDPSVTVGKCVRCNPIGDMFGYDWLAEALELEGQAPPPARGRIVLQGVVEPDDRSA